MPVEIRNIPDKGVSLPTTNYNIICAICKDLDQFKMIQGMHDAAFNIFKGNKISNLFLVLASHYPWQFYSRKLLKEREVIATVTKAKCWHL